MVAGTKPKSLKVGASSATRQIIRSRLEVLIPHYFGSTLAKTPDIINLAMACIQKESSFNFTNSTGPMYSVGTQNKVSKYPPAAKLWRDTTPGSQERANVINSCRALGLMQCTGWYLLKGNGPGGVSEIYRCRKDLASMLEVSVGSDVTSKLHGESNIDTQLIAGLIILENKYIAMTDSVAKAQGWPNRITGAFANYLGRGASDGISTPASYVRSILYGDSYNIANNGFGPNNKPLIGGDAVNPSTSSYAPVRTAASGDNKGPAGC